MKKQMMIPLITALVLAGSFAASATIPGSDGLIHACYRLSDGRLRVVDPAHEGSCAPSERALNWNEHGRIGPRGPKSSVAEHVGTLQFSLNASTDLGQDPTGADLAPAATQNFPAVGSRSTSALGTLFPGHYDLRTEFTDPPASVPTSDCTGTVVQTEVFVETEPVS